MRAAAREGAAGSCLRDDRDRLDSRTGPAPQADLAAMLGARWPALFDPDRPKPLAIGARREIAHALDLDRKGWWSLRKILGAWCDRPAYHRALASPGAVRFGLDGAPAEPVSETHQEHARQQLRRLGANGAKPVLRLPRPSS